MLFTILGGNFLTLIQSKKVYKQFFNKKMKDSNSIFQITLLKIIIIIYFLYIVLNSLGSSINFFHENADFGIWSIISFLIISIFILFVDIAIIYSVCKTFSHKNKRVYILFFQSIICAVIYFGLN